MANVNLSRVGAGSLRYTTGASTHRIIARLVTVCFASMRSSVRKATDGRGRHRLVVPRLRVRVTICSRYWLEVAETQKR